MEYTQTVYPCFGEVSLLLQEVTATANYISQFFLIHYPLFATHHSHGIFPSRYHSLYKQYGQPLYQHSPSSPYHSSIIYIFYTMNMHQLKSLNTFLTAIFFGCFASSLPLFTQCSFLIFYFIIIIYVRSLLLHVHHKTGYSY